MRRITVLTFLACLVGLPAWGAAHQAGAAPAKPNIVFMLVDNLGYGELGVYGGGILRGAPTPRIDTLAKQGMRLLNFNVEAQCTPSRSALMTGRFSIRSGTYAVPIGVEAEGLTRWEVTIAQLLSARGYATGMWGKWHLGSKDDRLPTARGFDEWYGIPRTYDECLWTAEDQAKGLWPSEGARQGWKPEVVKAENIYDARKGEKPKVVATLDLEASRNMDDQITRRGVDFMRRQVKAGKPFYAYFSFQLMHLPTLPGKNFVGKTGNGDWADCLAEMDAHVGQVLDALQELGVADNTLVVFTSDNGPEAAFPWQGSPGPWRGTYFTAMEGSLRAPCIVRWPGKVPAERVSNDIVHMVDWFTTLARVGGAETPGDRPIDGVDQLDFLLGKQEHSNREGFPIYVRNELYAVKWRDWKSHFIFQVNMFDTPQALPLPRLYNLLRDPQETRDVGVYNTWVAYPVNKIVKDFEESLKRFPPIPMGTPDPYTPPKSGQ